MFTAIATRYDLNNSLLSFGLHHRWKALAAGSIPALTHGRALDLGAGTGDLALLLDRRMGEHGRVVAMDLNFAMLRVGVGKIARHGLSSRIACFRGNAERIVFRDDAFDAVTAGFCIRNVGDRPQAFREIHRVLKPGGRFVCLEFFPVRCRRGSGACMTGIRFISSPRSAPGWPRITRTCTAICLNPFARFRSRPVGRHAAGGRVLPRGVPQPERRDRGHSRGREACPEPTRRMRRHGFAPLRLPAV